MNLIRKLAVTAAGLALAGSLAWAQSAMAPQDFANMAASSDLFEIGSSELAVEKAKNAEVKAFAEQMIKDHTDASRKLAAAAQADGVTAPTMMNEKHTAELEKLKNAGEADFDAAYVAAQVAGHEEALKLMTDFAESGEAASLKAHAEQTAPIIQMHYDHIKKIDESM